MTTQASATVKFDADTTAYVAGVAKVEAANKRVGQSAAGAGKTIEGAIGRAALKLEVLKRGLFAAANALDRVTTSSTNASTKLGDIETRSAEVLARMGAKNIPQLVAISRDTKGKNLAFLEALASESGQEMTTPDGQSYRRGGQMSDRQISDAIAEYKRGGELVYGQGGRELISGMRSGMSLEAIRRQAVASRPGLSSLIDPNGNYLRERATREAEEDAEMFFATDRRNMGLQGRRGRARLLQNSDITTFTGNLANSLDDMPGAESARSLREGTNTPLDVDPIVDELRRITGQMRSPAPGRLNLSAQNDGAK